VGWRLVCKVVGKGREGELMDFLVQGSLGAFCKGLPGSGCLAYICLAILGDFLGKRTLEYMELWSTFPPLQNISN
jgi:hypothetical protein